MEKTYPKPAKKNEPTGKQKMTEAECKRLGLDPSVYGYKQK